MKHVFRIDKENFRILDPMWIVNMSATDIDKLFRQDIFYEDKDVNQALQFQRRLFLLLSRDSPWKLVL
ncbi:hypothetical protein Hanom_Chr10g00873571 [Helianthus anomalus]